MTDSVNNINLSNDKNFRKAVKQSIDDASLQPDYNKKTLSAVYLCQSYYDNDNILQDCTCGKCEVE